MSNQNEGQVTVIEAFNDIYAEVRKVGRLTPGEAANAAALLVNADCRLEAARTIASSNVEVAEAIENLANEVKEGGALESLVRELRESSNATSKLASAVETAGLRIVRGF